jgi:hypothetical protein
MVTFEIESLRGKLFKTWFYLQNIQTGKCRARVAAVLPRQAMERFRQSLEISDEDILMVKPKFDDQERRLCAFCNDPDPEDDFMRVHYNGFLGDMCMNCLEYLRTEDCMMYQKSGICYIKDHPVIEARAEKFRKLLLPAKPDGCISAVGADASMQQDKNHFSQP